MFCEATGSMCFGAGDSECSMAVAFTVHKKKEATILFRKATYIEWDVKKGVTSLREGLRMLSSPRDESLVRK